LTLLSVVIPSYNSVETIGHTLASLLRNDFPKSRYK